MALESNKIISTEKKMAREKKNSEKKGRGMKDPKISQDREGRMTIVGGAMEPIPNTRRIEH